MEEVKNWLEPVRNALPPTVRGYWDDGGWWLVPGAAAVVLVLLLWGLFDRKIRPRLARRLPRLEDADLEYRENLVQIGPAPRPPGVQSLTVYHLAARLRLVILAPLGTESQVSAKSAGIILDRLVPGLGEIAAHDEAQVRIWPAQMSQPGFTVAFQRRTPRPEPEGQPSNWVLVSGKLQLENQGILIGLCLWTHTPTTVGTMSLETHQWLDVLRIKTS
jgi:hypothetical protein